MGSIDKSVYPGDNGAAAAASGPTFTVDAISDQDDLSPVTLGVTVTASSGSLTYAWTVNGATTGISDATAAAPTFTPTGSGPHAVACTVTDSNGAGYAAPVTFQVGQEGYYLAGQTDWTAGAAQDVVAGGDKAYTVDGVSWTLGGSAGCSAWTVGGANGYAPDANLGGTPNAYTTIQALYPGYALGDDILIIHHKTAGTEATNGNTVNVGVLNTGGTRESHAQIKRDAGAVKSRFEDLQGGWVSGSFVAEDPEVVAIRVVGEDHRYYTREFWPTGWPALSELTERGQVGHQRRSNAAANFAAATDRTNIYPVATGGAFSPRILATSIWVRG